MVQPALITVLITLAALCAPLACSVSVSAFTTNERLCVGDRHGGRESLCVFDTETPTRRIALDTLTTRSRVDGDATTAWPSTAVRTLLASGPPPTSTRC